MSPARNPGLRRRAVLRAAAGLAAATGTFASPGPARADIAAVQAAMKKLVGDAEAKDGKVTLTMPEIAENGNTVPLEISVDSPMTEGDRVKAVHVFADGNPQAEVVTFRFSPASGKATASTRMRLAQTQNVIAVAEMSDGSVYRTSREVKVTIGGCGG